MEVLKMLRTNTKIVRNRIRQYLLDSAFDYASECLEKDNPTENEIMAFVVNDIKRVENYRMVYGIMPQQAVIDYLQGLSLAVDYSYFDEWNRLNEWTEAGKDINKATGSELCKANEKYWNLLSMEILRWFDKIK